MLNDDIKCKAQMGGWWEGWRLAFGIGEETQDPKRLVRQERWANSNNMIFNSFLCVYVCVKFPI